METMITFAGVTITTLVALFAALALQTLFLKATFALMRPSTVNRNSGASYASGTMRNSRGAVEQGARLVAHAYGKTR
ncbi:MAG: hypothetical protein WCE52_14970 [Candidatus Acidiferrum sp.]